MADPEETTPKETTPEEATAKEATPTGWAWVQRNTGVVLTIIGLIIFGAVKFEYFLFFQSLNVDPEDVGLGYAQVLSRSALAAFFVAPLLLIFFGVGFAVAKSRKRWKNHAWESGAVGAALAILAAIAFGALSSTSAANAVKRGASVTPSLCNLLGLRAEVVHVDWIGPPPAKVKPPPTRATYIGSSDGSMVLYVTKTKQTLIVPSSDVRLTTRPGLNVRPSGWSLFSHLGCP